MHGLGPYRERYLAMVHAMSTKGIWGCLHKEQEHRGIISASTSLLKTEQLKSRLLSFLFIFIRFIFIHCCSQGEVYRSSKFRNGGIYTKLIFVSLCSTCVTDMAPPTVLVLGHSFVRRLKTDMKHRKDFRLSPNFKLDGTARIYLHGVGGRTVKKLQTFDLSLLSRLSPDIVILEIGTNDLSSLRPEVVGSQLEELVLLLRRAYGVKVVGVCTFTTRVKNSEFEARRVKLNQYLKVVLDSLSQVFLSTHRRFTCPSVTPFLPDGVHFNKLGQYKLYRSYRGAIIKAVNML